MKLLGIKKVSKMKITLEGTNNIVDMTEEKTSKLEKIEIEITPNKVQNEK